ncbi:hypothetical protein GCM10009827_086950 [Dactylosporangium maewongense]|uniref:Uncharacterized protein n=1 Tax=Dactylosporangium maewongense TaxID=634393 RepID=A0ABN2C4X4_9ACTN
MSVFTLSRLPHLTCLLVPPRSEPERHARIVRRRLEDRRGEHRIRRQRKIRRSAHDQHELHARLRDLPQDHLQLGGERAFTGKSRAGQEVGGVEAFTTICLRHVAHDVTTRMTCITGG